MESQSAMPPTEVSPFLIESQKQPPVSQKQSTLSTRAWWWKTVIVLAIAASVAAAAVFIHRTHHSNNGGDDSTLLSLKRNDNGDTAGYSEAMGNRTWILSGVVNCAKEDIDSWTCENCNDINGLENVTVIHETEMDLQMLLAFDKKYQQIIFSYRGSEASNYKDYNLDFIWADYEGDDEYCSEDESNQYCCGDDCKVHGGFQRAFKDIQAVSWDTIKQYISDFSEYPIMLTGYSLGGGLGHFAAMQLVRYLNEIGSSQPLTYYSHGSVRIGNAEMLSYYERLMDESESQYWRVTWLHDPIPKLPPYEIGYRHSGNEVWYYCWEDDMSYKICEDGDDSSCSDGYRQGNAVENLADHVYYYKYFNTCPKAWFKKYPIPTFCEDIDE